MIAPTVGRVVWYWSSYPTSEYHQPCAATIAFVHNDRRVNLSVVDHDGLQWSAKDVLLFQGDVPVKLTGPFCQWMPHQVGQAAKSRVTDDMVSRFLTWKLPKGFAPDCGVSFDGRGLDYAGHPHQWPTGTNLLDASQARAMLEHVLGG